MIATGERKTAFMIFIIKLPPDLCPVIIGKSKLRKSADQGLTLPEKLPYAAGYREWICKQATVQFGKAL
jgi:hypothetical protein